MLIQMQEKFQQVSENILSQIDTMGNRLDDLEKTIEELVKSRKDAQGSENHSNKANEIIGD